MIRRFCALVAMCLAAPIAAQAIPTATTAAADPNVYVSPVRRPGKVPEQFTSSGTIAGTGKRGTIWIERGQQPDGSWLYWRKGYAPAVEPVPPVVAPPVDTAAPDSALVGGQLFLRNDHLVAGFNNGGGLGTVNQQAPEGWPRVASRAGVGLLRIRDLTEAVAVLMVDETFSVGADGVYDFNGKLTGKVTASGRWDGATWTGIGRTGIAIEQRVSLAGGTIRFNIHLTNTTGRTLRDVRYKRSVDFDTLATPVVSPRIQSRGSVETILSNGALTVLRTNDSRATASFGGFILESPYDAILVEKAQAVGWVGKKADAGSNLTFVLGDLAPGGTIDLAFEFGFVG